MKCLCSLLYGETSSVSEGGASILHVQCQGICSNSSPCYLIPQYISDRRFFIQVTSIWHFPLLRQDLWTYVTKKRGVNQFSSVTLVQRGSWDE